MWNTLKKPHTHTHPPRSQQNGTSHPNEKFMPTINNFYIWELLILFI